MTLSRMGEATFNLDGKTLQLALNNAAWVRVEHLLDKCYLDAIGELVECEVAGRTPKLGLTGAILWGATRRHHPDIALEQCYDIVAEHSEIVMGPLGEAIRGSIKLREPDQGEALPAETPADGTGTTR